MKFIFFFVFFLISGIFVFFKGISLIAANLSFIINKTFFKNFNRFNPFLILSIGFLFSSIVQSTSASLSLVIPFVHLGIINPVTAIYLLLGFNIGTCSTLIINTFDKIVFFFIFIFLASVFYILRKKKDSFFYLSLLFLGVSLIFFSLDMINKSIFFLSNLSFYQSLVNKITINYFYPFFVGTIASILVQSSSVVLSTFQNLYLSSDLELIYLILISLGANVGSTITGVLASLKFDIETKRIAFFNVFLNLATSLIFLIFLYPLNNFIIAVRLFFKLSNSYDLALCHFLINFISSIIFFPFVKKIYALIDFYFPKII